MNYLPSRNAVFGVLGSAIVLSFPISAVRADGGNDSAPGSIKTPAAEPVVSTPEGALAGSVIARDKTTGELRPATAKEIKQLQTISATANKDKKGTRKPAKIDEVRLANGTVVTTLDSSFDVYSVATKGADGKIHTACVPGEKVESVLAAAQHDNLTKKEVLNEK